MHLFWQISGITLWVLVVGYILLRVIYGKRWQLKAGGNFFLGSGLMGASKKLVEEANQKTIKKETITEVAVHIFWRLTKIGIFGILIAMIPFVLLFQQNKLITKQNAKIDVQNNLIEAERRSSLVFLMSNILDKVNDEIKEQREAFDVFYIHGDTMKYGLSNTLIARIVSLSRAFKPYRMLEGDTLANDLISPERGQLFIALMESQLDSFTQNSIVQKGDFTNAIIGEINLSNAKLRNTNLRNADLRNADFSDADLRNANLIDANLIDADFSSANLYYANFSYSSLRNADFIYANLRSVDFSFVDLRSADLSSTDLSYANLRDVNLRDADLRDANFQGVRNLTVKQLSQSSSLYMSKNLPPEIETQLRKEKPCLLEKEGCPEK